MPDHLRDRIVHALTQRYADVQDLGCASGRRIIKEGLNNSPNPCDNSAT
jgi:hypothetical protein